jgi:hypothetical protein
MLDSSADLAVVAGPALAVFIDLPEPDYAQLSAEVADMFDQIGLFEIVEHVLGEALDDLGSAATGDGECPLEIVELDDLTAPEDCDNRRHAEGDLCGSDPKLSLFD